MVCIEHMNNSVITIYIKQYKQILNSVLNQLTRKNQLITFL